jgi:polygalacturonase
MSRQTLLLFLLSRLAFALSETIYNAVDFADENHAESILQRMIDDARQQVVNNCVIYIPSNVTVISAPFTIYSHMTLRVDGVLRAWNGHDDEEKILTDWPILPPLPTYPSSQDMGFVAQYKAFIYARNATNIRITGKGIIDGRGSWWWDQYTNKTKVLQAGRPNLIQLLDCTHVEMDTVTLRDSPFWSVHPVLCQFVHIHDLKIRARLYAPNVDGIDPNSCQHVLIENNDIACGDDHIAIKAGLCREKYDKNTSGNCTDPIWASGTYQTMDIVVRENIFRTGMGIAIGSETSGSIRGVHIYNNHIGVCESGSDTDTSCGWGPAIHLKTTIDRGGVIEDIVFENNTVYNTSMFILVEMDYQGEEVVPTDYPASLVRNVAIIGNRAVASAVGASISCSEHAPCRNVTIVGNVVENAGSSNPWNCQHVQGSTIHDNHPSGLECMNVVHETMTQ